MSDYSKELYNSLIETAQRLVLVLQAFDRRLTIGDLRVLEFFAVYGEDVGFPKSLQHMSAARFHAYGFREPLIKEALNLLATAKIVEGDAISGYKLSVTDLIDPNSFVGLLAGDYTFEFSAVCDYMAHLADEKGFDVLIKELTLRATDGLNVELDQPPSIIETDWFVVNLERDFFRMESLQWTAYALAEHVATLPVGLNHRLDPPWLTGLAEAARLEMKRVFNEHRDLVSLRASYGYN